MFSRTLSRALQRAYIPVRSSPASLSSGLRALSVRQMSSEVKYEYETLRVSSPSDFVKHVELNRPEKRNAISMVVTREIGDCFSKLAVDPDCRVVIFSGVGKVFSSGIDLNDSEFFGVLASQSETSRKAFELMKLIRGFQNLFNAIEDCPKPVVVAIQNACLGLAMDLVTVCDMRVCTQDAFYQIKEIDLGIAADIGVLQRFPLAIGNDSLARELIYTTRKFEAEEAKSMGFVSNVYPNQSEMMAAVFKMGEAVAAKSPVAVQGSKVNMLYSRDHGVVKGLEHMTTWQSSMLQSNDVVQSVTAALTKEKPTYSKL